MGSVKREFQSQYRESLLGIFWSIINPLAMIVVYTVVFSQVMKGRLKGMDNVYAYSIYLCSGILTWGFFADITQRAQNVFISNGNMLKKLNFPRLCLPVIVVISSGINFAIAFGLFTVFLVISGNFPGIVYLGLIPVLMIQVAFSIGLGIILGVLNVFFRDVGQFYGVVLQFWFWLTPIVYTIEILGKPVQSFLQLNPMTIFVGAYQQILVYHKWPDWFGLWPVVSLAIILCLAGMLLFRRRSGEIVDEL